jgi:CubicO group peptidase (beta-lactamase class C family)
MSLRSCRIVLFAAASSVLAAQTPPPKAVVAHVADSLAQDFIASRGAPGVSIALVRGRDTLAFGGWGKADLENDVPATARTVYRIGSITKQFTSAAVMQLVEQGKVKLDDSIGTYLPTLPTSWRAAPVRQYLNHTSGAPSYTDIGARWVRRWGEEMTPDTIVALTAHDTLWFPPGTKWRYDNTGYVVLGMLIERVAGRAWAEDFAERFAKPLGLLDTRWCDTKVLIPRRAQGYARQGTQWINAPYLAMTQPFSAGALCSTVGDLAKWNRALAHAQVVSAASYKLMMTPEGAAAPSHYGFGLTAGSLEGHAMISHGGGINGFISSNAWLPDAELSVTVLTNSSPSKADDLALQLARAALGIPLVQPLKAVALTAAERSRYVGVYALQLPGGPRDFTLVDRDGTLYAQLAGQGANPLIPLGNHVFGVEFDPTLRITFTLEGGTATKLVLVQQGQRMEGVRK